MDTVAVVVAAPSTVGKEANKGDRNTAAATGPPAEEDVAEMDESDTVAAAVTAPSTVGNDASQADGAISTTAGQTPDTDVTAHAGETSTVGSEVVAVAVVSAEPVVIAADAGVGAAGAGQHPTQARERSA